MSRWGLLLVLVAVLVTAGITVPWWFAPLLAFFSDKSDLIQGLANAIQIVLWVIAGIALFVAFMRRKKQSPVSPAMSTHTSVEEKKVGERGVQIDGDAADNIIVTGDQNQVVRAETYIGKQVLSDPSTASAVGCFPNGASPYGCEDMSGNVLEWTRSLWGKDWQTPEFKYPYRLDDGRENLDESDEIRRVLRGGAFDGNDWYVRCAYRYRGNPDDRDHYVGFVLSCAHHSDTLASGSLNFERGSPEGAKPLLVAKFFWLCLRACGGR